MSNEELVAAIQAGATERMGELWERVAGLVKWKAKRIMTALDACGGRGVEFDDLYQSGYPALAEAVETYNSAGGGAFSTWFMFYLQKAFAVATGFRTRRGQNEPLNNAVSLDTPLGEESDSGTMMEVVADPDGQKPTQSVEEAIFQQQLREALEAVLDAIPEQCSEVLRLRYYEGQTLAEIAEVQGISPERVRNKENKGLRELRKPRNACHLRPFHNFDFYCHTSLNAFNQTGMSVQERYLVIDEERREREAQERTRRDEEWNRRAEESRKWLAERRARREAMRRETEELASLSAPEDKEKLQRILAECGTT